MLAVLAPAHVQHQADAEVGAALREAERQLPPDAYLILTRTPTGSWYAAWSLIAGAGESHGAPDPAEALLRLAAALEAL